MVAAKVLLFALSAVLATASPVEDSNKTSLLSKRAICNNFVNKGSRGDVQACADRLKSNGLDCTTNPGQAPPRMCAINTAHVYGVSNTGSVVTTSCANVGCAVQNIIDSCTGDYISGTENACGNGNMKVEVHGTHN